MQVLAGGRQVLQVWAAAAQAARGGVEPSRLSLGTKAEVASG